MYEKKSSTLLRGCIQLIKMDSHNQGCQCHQNKDQPINCHSTEPTGAPSSHHIYTYHHQICHPSQQATCKCTNGYNGKDTSGCHDTVQYHALHIQQLKLPANYTPHLIYLGKPLEFSILHKRSSLTHHALY